MSKHRLEADNPRRALIGKDEYLVPKSTLIEEMRADPLLQPGEIAKVFKVNSKTVVRWCDAGKFGEAPAVIRLPGRNGQRRIRTSAYRKVLEQIGLERTDN